MPPKKSTFLLKLSKDGSSGVKFPLFVVIFLEMISNLHVISAIIRACFPSTNISSSSIVGVVKEVLLGSSVFDLWDVPTFESLPKLLWIMLMVYLLIHLMFLLTVCLLIKFSARHAQSAIVKIFAIISLVHSKVLFYPIHTFYLQIIGARVNKLTINSLLEKPAVVAMTILFAVLNFLFVFLKEMLFFRITKGGNSISMKNNTQPKLLLVLKLVLPLIFHLSKQTESVAISIAVISIVLGTLLIYVLYTKLPFYNVTLLKVSYGFASAILSVAIIGLVASIVSVQSQVTDVLLVIWTTFTLKTSFVHLDLLFTRILKGEISNAERAIHFPILLKRYTSKYAGLILVRKAFPEESVYFYNSFDPRLDDAEHQKNGVKQREVKQGFYAKVVDILLARSHGRFQRSEVFLLYMARLFMKKLDNASEALNLIEKVKSMNGSLSVRSSAETFLYSLQEAYFKKFSYSEDDLELAKYFDYREEFNLLKQQMQAEIAEHLEFWNRLAQDRVDVKSVIDFSNNIDAIYLRIRSRWRRKAGQFTKIYPSSLLMYGLYLDAVRGLPSESMPMIQKFYNFNKSHGYRNKMGILDDTSALVVASIEKGKQGLILDASSTIESLFNYPKERLVGGKINLLMPPFIAKSHDWFMQAYTQSSVTKVMNREISTFGKTGDNALIELDINLKLYPFLEKGVNMMAHIQQKNFTDMIFIVSPNGSVVEYSNKLDEAGAEKGLNFKTNNAMANILESCSDFSKINAAFNTIYGGPSEMKTKMYEDTDMSFLKETEAIQITKENQHTQMDTYADHSGINLRTRPNEDLPLIQVKNPSDKNLHSEYLAPMKSKMTNPRGLTSNLEIQMDEEEAKQIIKKFEEGGQLRFNKPALNVNLNKELIVMDVKIRPYVLLEEVYKIVKVSHMDLEEEGSAQKDFGQAETLLPFATDTAGMKLDQYSWHNSSATSKTLGLSNEDIPDEREDEKPRIGSGEGKMIFKQLILPIEDSQNQNTTTKKLEDDFNPDLGGKRKDQDHLDLRQSIGRGASSTKSYSHMDLKLIKTLNDFFGEEKIRFITKVSIYSVYLIMIGVLVLALVNYFFTQKSLTEINGGVTIVDTASRRLTSALRAWQWVLLIYSRMVGLRPASALASQIQTSLNTESLKMQTRNTELKENLDSYGSDEILDEIFSVKIKLYDPTTLDLLTDGPLDSFTANNLISLKNQIIGSWTGTDAQLLTRSEPLTSINNTANDFLVSSESQISQIQEGLQTIITKNKTLLRTILIIENLALITLCVSLFAVARVVTKTYTRTFQALVRLTNESIEERIYRIKKFQTSLEDNIEAKSFIKNLNIYLNFFEDNANKKVVNSSAANTKGKVKDKEKTMRFYTKSYSIRAMVLYIAKYISVSYLVILVISGLFEVLYFESINSFDTLKSVNEQLSITNKLSYQSCLVLSSFYFNALFADQPNLLIRNESPAEQVDANLAEFGNVNQLLLNALFNDESSSRSAVIQDFLQSNLCIYLSDDIRDNCTIATQGNTLGLLGFNLKYYTISSNYINLYKENSTTANTQILISNYFDTVTSDITVLDAAYVFLTNYILSGFHDEVDNLESLNLYLSLMAMIFILIATAMIQRITLRKLIDLDNSQKKVFRTLTYYVFSQNKSVGFLLKKEFGDEVEGINRILFGN